MQNASDNPSAARKLAPRAASVAIALLQLACTIPSLMGIGEFVYVLCLFGIPCSCVCIFTGRNKILAAIGWVLQILLLIMMVFPSL
jgi:hypothetical protein